MPEFGNSIVCDQGFKNVFEDGKAIGFQVRVRISYYRGIPVSLLEGYEIVVDDETYTNKDISFSLDGEKFYTMEELGYHPELRWEFGDKAYLHIAKPGGLKRGLHTVKVTQYINVPYLPFATNFHQEKKLTIVCQEGDVNYAK